MDLPEKQRLFEAEYTRLFTQIYRYIRYRVPQAEEAEDLVAEALLQAYAKLDVFVPEEGNLAQWLTGFARHKVQDHWRRVHPTVPLEVLENVLAAPDARADILDDRMAAESLLRELPPAVKALIAMRFADGLTHKQIAEVTGKDPQAIRQFFSRLQRKLRLESPDGDA